MSNAVGMKQWQRALFMSAVAIPLALALDDARAQPPCRPGRAVDLRIQLQPSAPATRAALEQRLTAELRARDLDACAPAGNERSLAQVNVSAPVPQLSPTSVQIHTAAGAAAGRTLDVAGLPIEARPSAIASAADELLASLLQSPAAPAVSTDAAAPPPPVNDTARPAARARAWQVPRLELGLGGGGAIFEKRGKAYRGELLARWRPLPRLSATLRVGGDHRLTADTGWRDGLTGRSIVDSSSGWHAGVDAGFELTEPAEGFGLAAVAGLALARLQLTEEWPVATPVGIGTVRQPAVSSWEGAVNLGGEVSYRGHGWGCDLAFSMLVPLTPRERNWRTWENEPEPTGDPQQNALWDYSSAPVVPPGAGFGEQLGGQLDVRLWVTLDS